MYLVILRESSTTDTIHCLGYDSLATMGAKQTPSPTFTFIVFILSKELFQLMETSIEPSIEPSLLPYKLGTKRIVRVADRRFGCIKGIPVVLRKL